MQGILIVSILLSSTFDDYFLNEHILWDVEMKNLYSFIEDDEQLTAYNSETEEEKDNE